MDNYYIFKNVKKPPNSYNEKYDKINHVSNSENINIGETYINPKYNYLSELDIFDNSNTQIKHSTHFLNDIKNKNKLTKESNQFTHCSYNTKFSIPYDTNLYGNNFIQNNRCSYIKAKYPKETNYNINNITEEKKANTIMLNLDTFNNKHTIKNDNDTKQIDKCIMIQKNYTSNSLKINKNMKSEVLEKCTNHTQPNILSICKFDNKSDIIKMEKYKNNLINIYDNENSESNFETNKFDDDIETIVGYKTFEDEMQNVEKNNNCLSVCSLKDNEEINQEENIYLRNSMTRLIKKDVLINTKKELSSYEIKNNKSSFYYRENNIFIKFIMSEININIKVYKLLIILIVLILLSLSKNIQKYAVVTRKCYNIYESPFKSTKRLLKYMIIVLKILYKCILPIFSYILSFIFGVIIKIFIILNIPICIFILYWKYILKNEGSNIKFYFQICFKIYMYIIMQVAHIFKNYTQTQLLSLSYKIYQLIFIYICRFFIKFYNDIL
ncbi:conserved Plasmodium protein, unknown function [Plasmodium yoelii]|uniref:Uncharacterized protein n=1 Tax=Plasmodium yoelii TaxID=5861 RepID=A0A077Y2E5_PLAYE|nr:conserved Plasmodium protein, unknown function [Plasmodium yoelii]CDU16531.1 conserved Plasmodium protein, unknown function [Plasmodium yoelii]VTZ73402.1 conserved Plasmodium protein, unknown function [Plasmodium yoelii]|eukprot:XP_022811577.1 conserved Plasmodium protein, unknown function [Plasmodium yoelii]